MIEILEDCADLILGLGVVAWDTASIVMTWLGSILWHLHVEAPRLEGLLVGIFLAWMMARRDKHPVLRVLSAPLKLVLDILDLVWDQVVESVSDVKSVVLGWLSRSLNFVRDRITGAWHWVMNSLLNIRDKLMSVANKD